VQADHKHVDPRLVGTRRLMTEKWEFSKKGPKLLLCVWVEAVSRRTITLPWNS